METIGLEDAAAYLHMNAEVLRRMAKVGKVPGRKTGKRWVFVKQHLAEWISTPAPITELKTNSIVINHTKMEQEKCHSIDAVLSTISRSQPQMVEEYRNRLGLASKKTRKDSTTN